jgi:hypothetical protein
MANEVINQWAQYPPDNVHASISPSGNTLNTPDESLPSPSLQSVDVSTDNEGNTSQDHEEESVMSEKNYVTQEEFNHLSDNLHNEIKQQSISTNAKIDNFETAMNGELKLINERMSNGFNAIPGQIEAALNKHDKEKAKEHQQTVRYLIGTVSIGLASIIVAIIGLIVSLHH